MHGCTGTLSFFQLQQRSPLYAALRMHARLQTPADLGSAVQVPSAGPEAIDLMTRLCHWNPARRLSAAEALQHPFFQVIFNHTSI